MFLDFYRLREQPFGVTPDPRFLYLSGTHREALASLLYGIETGRGFLTLIAKPGMGKTTLLFQLLDRLRKLACTAFLFQTQCNSRELFRYLLSDMGFDTRGQDMVEMHEKLNEALIRVSRAGMRFVLIIDEAQDLEDSVLETVRLLSDFETPNSKLIQIVLAGQPQLAAKLARPSLAQLRQRIAILSRLDPFAPPDTDHYIDHRLQVGGYAGGLLFTREARAMIAARSQGIPRNINNICFNALSLGYALKRRKIDPAIVQEVMADMNVDSLAEDRPVAQQAHLPTSATAPAVPAVLLQKGGSRFRPLRAAALAVLFALLSPRLFSPVNELNTLSAVVSDPSKYATREPSGELTVIVQPQETLEKISLRYLRRFDAMTFEEILKLNPQLADPNHIEVGQRIRLPQETHASVPGYTSVAQGGEATTSLKD